MICERVVGVISLCALGRRLHVYCLLLVSGAFMLACWRYELYAGSTAARAGNPTSTQLLQTRSMQVPAPFNHGPTQRVLNHGPTQRVRALSRSLAGPGLNGAGTCMDRVCISCVLVGLLLLAIPQRRVHRVLQTLYHHDSYIYSQILKIDYT